MSTLTLFSFDKAFDSLHKAEVIKRTVFRFLSNNAPFTLGVQKMGKKDHFARILFNFSKDFLEKETNWQPGDSFQALKLPEFSGTIALKLVKKNSPVDGTFSPSPQWITKIAKGERFKTDVFKRVLMTISSAALELDVVSPKRAVSLEQDKDYALKNKEIILIKIPQDFFR